MLMLSGNQVYNLLLYCRFIRAIVAIVLLTTCYVQLEIANPAANSLAVYVCVLQGLYTVLQASRNFLRDDHLPWVALK